MSDAVNVDKAIDKCKICKSNFAECHAKRIVFGIDVDKSVRGRNADKVIECDAYEAKGG